MSRLRWLTAVALAAMSIGLIASCGGDDDSSNTAGSATAAGGDVGQTESAGGGEEASQASIVESSLSLEEYRRQANEACMRIDNEEEERATEYAEKHPDESLREKVQGAYEEVFLPAMEARVNELSELGAPAGGEKQVRAFIRALEAAIDAAEEEGPASAGVANEATRARNLMIEYKLPECNW